MSPSLSVPFLALALGLVPIRAAARPGAETQAASAPVRFAEGAASTGWMPMDLYLERYIYLRGRLAGVETDVVLDSGAGGTVVDSAFAAELGLARSGGVVAKGVGGNQPAAFLDGLELELGALTLSGIRGVAIDLAGVSALLGRGMPVILGREAFHELIVDIDYPRRRVAFHRRDDFAYTGGGRSVPLTLTGDGLCAVEIELEGRARGLVQVDTGSGGTLDVFAEFAEEHELLAGRSPSSQKQGGGVGGRILSTVATLRSLTFAGHELRDVPVSFPQATQGVFHGSELAGNLGSAVFRRFRLVFDYGRRTLHVEPGEHWETAPFRRDRVGIEADFLDGALAVVFVAPGSPAAKAGITVGERIRSLGGQALDAAGWRAALSAWADASPGSEVHFEDGAGRARSLVAADYY
jgi:hypothetical protein